MKTLVVLSALLLLFGSGPTAAGSGPHWQESFYRTFSPADFERYGPAITPIEFHSIDYPLIDAAVHFELNRTRRKYGTPPLSHSSQLEKAAKAHSAEMVRYGFFSHSNPRDPAKKTPSQRIASSGVRASKIAENIAIAFGMRYESGAPFTRERDGRLRDARTGELIRNHTYLTFARSLVEAWMNSPEHRSHILDKALRFAGVGAVHFKDGGMDSFMVTLDLCSGTAE